MTQPQTFTVTWHYQDADPLTQAGFATRDHAEAYVRSVEAQRRKHSHTNVTITPTPATQEEIARRMALAEEAIASQPDRRIINEPATQEHPR